MKMFFDSSAFAKRYIAERGSEDVDQLCMATDELALCVICVPEIVSALNRRVREKTIHRTDYSTVKARLLNDIRDVEIVQLTDDIVIRSLRILETNAIRAMDALHVASALAWKAQLFVTSDENQFKVAKALGMPCELV